MSNPLASEDEAILQRYREQGTEQPSAAMDARILAAARQALERRRPSLPARLRHWLAGASLAQRGSLAFGSLASLALALGLVWQGLPRQAMMLEEDRVAAAPVPVMSSAEDSRSRLERHAARPVQPSSALSARPAAPREHAKQKAAPRSQAAISTIDSVVADSLDEAVLEILRLRAQGRPAEAQERLRQLHQQFSEAAVQQRLDELSGLDE